MTDFIDDDELRDIFRAESEEHVQRIESGLLALERLPDDAPLVQEVFREAHSLKGAARMLGLHEIQSLAHEIENLLGEVRQGRVRITAAEVAPQLVKLDRIRALVSRAVVRASEATPAPTGPLPGCASLAAPPAAPEPAPEPASEPASEPAARPVTPGLAAPWPDFRVDTLRIEAHRLDALMQLGAELVVSRGRIASWLTAVDDLIAQCERPVEGTSQPAPPQVRQGGQEVVRAGLAQLRARMSADSSRLDVVAGALGEGIRKLRLLPVSTLLDLFPRMVHDMSAELGKPVDYAVEGASVVADKRILEELKAPLMHLLRNAIDHGIESPAQRLDAGKPATGRVRVRLWQGGESLGLAVEDDGRGLDPQVIGRRAVQQGLVSEEELAHLSESQAQALILRAGFTTAAQVTEVSGRGVGLDVVRSAVERLHGTLEMTSTPGAGTCITLRLPVSLTATRALMVEEAGLTYALPLDDVAFLRRVPASEVVEVAGRWCFQHAGQAIGLQSLGVLLGVRARAPEEPGAARACVVLRVGGDTLALQVDAVRQAQDIVLKPTPPPLTRLRHVAGVALLDSGWVCPVLHAGDLWRTFQRASSTARPGMES